MLSFGIRNGQGFDRPTIARVMENIPVQCDYNFVVIGTNPGGVACAREASAAGKKTALIRVKRFSPAEEEGFDEDLEEMAEALADSEEGSGDLETPSTTNRLGFPAKKERSSSNKSVSMTGSRKVRLSRLDLNNELYRRREQCIKLMQNVILLGDVVEDAHNCGWRLTTVRPPFTLNWRKMAEEIMDYTLKENWELVSALGEESVEMMTGIGVTIKGNAITVKESEHKEYTFTSELICLALPSEYIFPEDVLGAKEYGITCDDFIRMSESPEKTLVVGLTPEGLECAGIVSGCRFPVTVVSRTTNIKDCDREILGKIMDNLRQRGVVFKESTSLVSLEKTADRNKIIATFEPFKGEENKEKHEEEKEKDVKKNHSEEQTKVVFDTVIFAVGRKMCLDKLNGLEMEIDPISQKIKADGKGTTTLPFVYAVGDILAGRPEGFEISQLDGKLLGRRLFHEEKELMDYGMIPTVIYTPLEYAWVGLSEDSAFTRLGRECVDVYFGRFKPLDFVMPPKKEYCFAKVIVFKSGNVIAGLHVLGPGAGDIIQGFAAAIRNGLTLQNFQTIVGVVASKAQNILKLKEVKTFREINILE